MQKHPIKENEFFPAPAGVGGIGVQPGWDTFSSPNVTQEPGQFSRNFNDNKSVGSKGNTTKDVPGETGSLARGLDSIYAKKDTPNPDEIVCGIKYELGQQIKKDRRQAKEEVVKNLRKDPHYYSNLKMLNISDEDMVNNMTEQKHPNDVPAKAKVSANIEETKKIFAEMTKGKDQKYVVNSKIVDVMKEMWEAKRQRSSWKQG